MDSAAHDDASLAQSPQGSGHEGTDRGENQRRVELIGRLFVGAPGPDRAELHGEFALPRAAGEEKGTDGPVITTSRSLIVPFLQFSPRRDLRERAHTGWASRGMRGGETDNRGIAAEMLKLRHERARLLGHESFADYRLAVEMAKTPDAVRDLLMAVWTPARAQAERDAAVLAGRVRPYGRIHPPPGGPHPGHRNPQRNP